LTIKEMSSGKMLLNIFDTLQSFARLMFRKWVWQIELDCWFLTGQFKQINSN